MIFFKYLVPIVALLLAGSSSGWAAGDSPDPGAASTTTTASGASSTPKTHHRRHHTKTATAAINGAPASAAAPAIPPASTAAATADSGPASTSARHSGTSHATATAETTNPGGTTSVPATAPSTNAANAAAIKPGTTHHGRHHHGATTSVAEQTTNAPATAATGVPPTKPAGAGTASGAAVTNVSPEKTPAATKTTAATTGKGRHHRHGRTTAAAKPLPEPAIVVPNTHPSVVSPPPATTATLPTLPPISEPRAPASSVPVVQTGLPVARPGTGTTATLPIAPFRPPPPALFNFPFKDYPQERRTRTYPWKMGIITTVFWIGEGSTPISAATNKQSAWDMNWVHNNGGADDQNDMSGYASADHASTLNPFYVALPFNDLAYPDKTARWLPSGWYKSSRHGERPVSACQGRWVEIKNREGRYCFAQWEDVGPIMTDDAEYVFGPERPSGVRGLDVSPAVAKYLGFDSSAITSWRFVDDPDVLPGMWLRYDEQALLFRAIKESLHGSPTPRIQDLDEPVPDPDDSSQKKAGAARG